MPFDSEISQQAADLILLEQARERVARAWCRTHLRVGRAYCLVGALMNAPASCDPRSRDFDLNACEPIYREGAALAKRLLGLDYGWGWNDWPGRTQAEVVALFDAAIERRRAAP